MVLSHYYFACIMVMFFVRLVVILFFFFKQKTAYEMRISDWSSDVCSSDLVQNAEVDLYATQQSFLQTGMDSLLNRVELYKALGGGWLKDSAQGSASVTSGTETGTVEGADVAGTNIQ